ncbi:MAG: hypothetical protein A2X86_21825 [Bdellovibrionales bacterium GWA2_49_15]|nr:MAG: hypothetical protein A2X86_21825 [Bdellovibrionales bacterium GWA2_49_15]HAZ12854.1 hypothetical protein [Bdellovibrionales bacterium]
MEKKPAVKKGEVKKRKQVRFKPDPNVLAAIDLSPQNKKFAPTLRGLVFSESYGGCGVVMLLSPHLMVGDVCKIEIGVLAPMKAQVMWRTQLDDQVMKLGLQLLE